MFYAILIRRIIVLLWMAIRRDWPGMDDAAWHVHGHVTDTAWRK